MASSKEDIISNLRAIIISSKGGLKLSDVRVKSKILKTQQKHLWRPVTFLQRYSIKKQLIADYREAFGVDIPLKALGYGLLEDFFKNNPQDFTIVGNTVQAVLKPSSVHIVSLVSRQSSKKKGRSKLSSKQPRTLRKPIRTYDPMIGTVERKPDYSVPPRFSRQSSNAENLASALKQMQEIQQMTASEKPAQTLQKPLEDKIVPVQTQKKSLEELKCIKRTVVNEQLSSVQTNSTKPISEGKTVSFSEIIPFEDFEDLHISSKAQSRLLRIKSEDHKKLISDVEPSLDAGESVGSPPPSPFTRSLANTTQEEILMAKKIAQAGKDDYKLPSKPNTPVDVTLDSDDDTKYEHKLKQFCIEKGLKMPIYSVLFREPLNQPKCYGCKISIGGNFIVSTYPVETHSEATARELASKKAYNLLTLNNNLPAPVLDSENIVKLRTLCSEKNLPDPIFKLIECRPKNEPGYYICKVRIGEDILLSSYPEEVRDEFIARDVAAKKAYKYLCTDSTSPSAAVSKSEKEILSQILNILKTKNHGVWSNKLQSLYMDTYNEMLPQNWFDLVKSSSKFEINHIEKAGFIIRTKSDVQLAEETTESIVPATIKMPELEAKWTILNVYITYVVNTAKIWCRFIGQDYSELYDSMMAEFDLHPPTESVKNPVVGQVYLISLDECWNRVRVKEIFPETQEVSVFFIDVGVEEVAKLSQLFYMKETFFSIAPQAVLLSLYELDRFAEFEPLKTCLFQSLLGNSFIADVVAILDGGNTFSVVLWDTSTPQDVNLNKKLIKDALSTLKSTTLPSMGLVKEMFVSCVEDNGDVYLQTNEADAQCVLMMISLILKYVKESVPAGNKIDTNKLYVTRCSKNGLFCRAKLSKPLEKSFVLMRFIDIGYEQQVSMSDLIDLERTELDLATIPSQAVRTSLSGLRNVNSKILSKLRELILEQNVLVKVTQADAQNAEDVPIVELFKRSQPDGILSSVINKILKDKELLTVDAPVRKKSYVIGLESTLSNDLPMPDIPPIGSYFDVIVTLAANPCLFTVQPLVTQSELMQLMFRLQEKCQLSFSKPLPKEDFKIGNLYAVKHPDGYWYRAYAQAVISLTAFSVCLCDFGDFIVVTAEHLMPLSSEFKTFPYQAIRAYLAGVTPVNKDWRAVDCITFKTLVVQKQLTSQVVEINRDLKNPNYITLGLILIDTSTKEDIYIHRVLIENGMAVLKR